MRIPAVVKKKKKQKRSSGLLQNPLHAPTSAGGGGNSDDGSSEGGREGEGVGDIRYLFEDVAKALAMHVVLVSSYRGGAGLDSGSLESVQLSQVGFKF
jgi:hypothetical protein